MKAWITPLLLALACPSAIWGILDGLDATAVPYGPILAIPATGVFWVLLTLLRPMKSGLQPWLTTGVLAAALSALAVSHWG